MKNKRKPCFRSSKLTFLLEEYLSGNSKTIVIGTISPNKCHLSDTKNTLRFLQTVASVHVGRPKATIIVNNQAVTQENIPDFPEYNEEEENLEQVENVLFST